MAEQGTYTLYIDWDADSSFATAGDDVSADLKEATINRGFANPLTRVCMTGRADFILNNVGQAYSPPLDATVLPMREVKFDMTYGGSTVTLFRGFIESIQPAAGSYGSRDVVVRCVDAMTLLDIFEGRLAIQINVHADDIIDDVVSDVYTPPSTNYQAGLNQFPTSGERWALHMGRALFGLEPSFQKRVRASQKIIDACASDWGRFFIGKDGAPTFYNRHQMPLDATVDLTINNDAQVMSYTKRTDQIYNWIEVTYLPRSVGENNEVLGSFAPERAVRIGPLETDTFTIQFRDPSNRAMRIGGLSVVTPVAGTDYAATDDEAGEGNVVTGNLSVTFTAYADHAEVEIENTHLSTDAYIQFFQVRGRPVRTREPETVQSIDGTSNSSYGQRRLPISATLMSNNAQAQSLADYLLDNYKDPHDTVGGLRFLANKSAAFMAAARDLELMDKVQVTESQTGLSSFQGHIYHMEHRIVSDRQHWVTLDLETPYSITGDPFLIGPSGLDGPDVIIY